MEPSTVGAILLAAGASRRMQGESKLLTEWEGMPLVRRQAKMLLQAGVGAVIVITGAESEAVGKAIDGLVTTCLHNPRWPEGIGTSISAGIDYLNTTDLQAALVLPCDLPLCRTEDIVQLCTLCPGPQGSAAIEVDDAGTPGAPAIFGRGHFPILLNLEGDTGAKRILRDLKPIVLRAPHLRMDADDQATWARLRGARAQPRSL